MSIDTVELQQQNSEDISFEVIRTAADAYLNADKPLYITARDLCKRISHATTMMKQQLQTYDPNLRSTGPYIIDVRTQESEMRDLYYYGHIPGAVSISWREITRMKHISSLPNDREIVIYSSNGQTGGQVAAILNLMGFDAVNLKWGITSWSTDEDAAPGRYERSKDILWQNSTYRSTVTINLEEEKEYSLPDAVFKGQTNSGIIWSSAEDYLNEYKPANISASKLYDPMFQIVHPLYISPYEDDPDYMLVLPFGVLPGENDEPFEWPFILDVRDTEDYDSGHIPGCLHIPSRDIFKTDNLKKLPTDKQIVVVSRTGHTSAHITALLNMLGYDAVNMKWGMSGWCLPQNGNEEDYYHIEKDCTDYPVIRGWIPGRPAECKS